MQTEKLNQFILKLIKLTKDDEIKWTVSKVALESTEDEVILDKVYLTTIDKRSFRLFRYKVLYWFTDIHSRWEEKIRLQLIDGAGQSEFEFMYENSLNDLYEIVREQTSNINNLVDDFLGFKLTILEATYGVSGKSMDVTKQLTEKVSNNKLSILASNEIAGDPAPGVKKKLKVSYSYGDKSHAAEVIEGHRLSIP